MIYDISQFPYKKTNATNTFHNYPQDDSILNAIDEKLTDSALGDSIVVSITIFFPQSKHISITYNYIFKIKGIKIFISPLLQDGNANGQEEIWHSNYIEIESDPFKSIG